MSSSRHESSDKKKFSPKQKWGGKQYRKKDEQHGQRYVPSGKKHEQPLKQNVTSNRRHAERSGEWKPRRDPGREGGRRSESFSQSSSSRRPAERSGEWKPQRDPGREGSRRSESFSPSSNYRKRNGNQTAWKTWEELKSPSSKRKQEREDFPLKLKPKIGYFSKDGRHSDGTHYVDGKERTQPRFDKRNKSPSPGWMPRRDEARTEVKKEEHKGERHRSFSADKQERQKDGQDRRGRNDRDQRPKVQHQKKDWKERSEGYSRGDKKRKRHYSRGDNPSRRIRPPT